MHKLLVALALSIPLGVLVACSDADGAGNMPTAPPSGGGGGTGGPAGGGGGPGGSGGVSGAAGRAGSDAGGSAGLPGCRVTTGSDAGPGGTVTDAGTLDGGLDGGGLDAGGFDDGGADLLDLVSFSADIRPIFEISCGPCHVDLGYGGHNVGGELEVAYQDAVVLGQTLITRIDGGGMPPPNAAPPNDCGAQGRGSEPGDQGCLTVAEVALVQAWIDQCYPR